MKKRIAYVAITAVVTATAFFAGREAAINDYYLIDPAEVVDWNTNGEELSLLTAEDYEYYCYKGK